MTEYTRWCLDFENKDVFPHSAEGNEVYLQEMSGELEGQKRIIIWCDLSDEPDTFPSLTIQQAKQLRWALGKALKDYKQLEEAEK